jgi:hypothetical protein
MSGRGSRRALGEWKGRNQPSACQNKRRAWEKEGLAVTMESRKNLNSCASTRRGASGSENQNSLRKAGRYHGGGRSTGRLPVIHEAQPGMMSLLAFRLLHIHARPIASNKSESERSQYLGKHVNHWTRITAMRHHKHDDVGKSSCQVLAEPGSEHPLRLAIWSYLQP